MTFTDDFRNGTRSYKIIDMAVGFHYVVKAKLIRYKSADEIKFLEIEEVFKNETPILSREAAFNFYQNYIDVLLEGKGKKYFSDSQAREELKTFISTGTTTKVKFGDKEFEFDDSQGNGIGVFLVVDVPQEKKIETLSLNEGDEFLIHGIGNLIGGSDNTDYVIGDLEQEFELYEHFKYDTKDKSKEVVYCSRDEWEEGYREDEPATYKILETPFDWTGFDKPYWWGEPEEEESKQEVQQITKTVEQIIDGGEGNQVEFKPTLFCDYDNKSIDIEKKEIIAKTICAFLNSNGGYLLIGINDNKTIRGLANDFGLSNGKDPKDFFKLEFDDMIEIFISSSIINYIGGEFYQIEDKEIFVVTVQPSKRRPIFLKKEDNKKLFFVRRLASTKRLYDMEEIANYCIDKWTT